MSISIGSDPELMLRDRNTGRIISAAGLIGGTKGKAKQMTGLPEGYGIQEDNVMVEFNIPPVSSSRRWVDAHDDALDWIQSYLAASRPDLELDVGHTARVLMNDQLETLQSQEFGCSPDFEGHNSGAQSDGVSPSSLATADGAWRFCGAHVHIGYTSEAPAFIAAQFADVFLGLPSIGLDVQGLRRQNYGRAGRFRPCSYGIEYRTLGNFWLWDRETTRDVGRRALELGAFMESREEQLRKVYTGIPWIDVAKAINTEDVALATDLMAFISDTYGVL